MEQENINTNNIPLAENEFEVNPQFVDYVNQNANQPEGASIAGSKDADDDFHDASDFIQPDEENTQTRKVSQRELLSLGSVNSQGLLESAVGSSRRSKPALKALRAKYDMYLQDVLEKELYVREERHDPILPIAETSIKRTFQDFKSMADN